MDSEFVTKALEEDRYLKAVELVDQFHDEIRRELRRVSDQIVAEIPELFPQDIDPSWNDDLSAGKIIAYCRYDYEMARRATAAEDASPLKLNVSIRWVDPVDFGHPDIDGALTACSYKIKRARAADHDRVMARTNEDGGWDVQFSEDAYRNSPGICYVPVQTADHIEAAFDELSEHFGTYGQLYGEPR